MPREINDGTRKFVSRCTKSDNPALVLGNSEFPALIQHECTYLSEQTYAMCRGGRRIEFILNRLIPALMAPTKT